MVDRSGSSTQASSEVFVFTRAVGEDAALRLRTTCRRRCRPHCADRRRDCPTLIFAAKEIPAKEIPTWGWIGLIMATPSTTFDHYGIFSFSLRRCSNRISKELGVSTASRTAGGMLWQLEPTPRLRELTGRER